MSSIYRQLLLSFVTAVFLIGVYHFSFSPTEVIVTQPPTPKVETSYSTPGVVRDSAENTDFTVAVYRTIDAVVHITNPAKNPMGPHGPQIPPPPKKKN